jgi:hypothetical protein
MSLKQNSEVLTGKIFTVQDSINLQISSIKEKMPSLSIHEKTNLIALFCKNVGNYEEALLFLESEFSEQQGFMAGILSILACFHSRDPLALSFILKHLETNKHKDIIWVYYNMSHNMDMDFVDACIDKFCKDKEEVKAWVRKLNSRGNYYR